MYKLVLAIILFILLYSRQINAQTITPAPCSVTLTPTQTPTITPTVTQILNYENIFISEFMVDPLSGEVEWVELYNDNAFDVNLSGWKIDDIADAGGTPRTINLNIISKNYTVVDFSTSLFNNDSDFVRLLDSTGVVKDSFEYSASIKGKTIGRSPSNFSIYCFQEPSKNLVNTSCINTSTPSPTLLVSSQTYSPTPRPTVLAANNIIPTSKISSKFSPIKDVHAATNDQIEDSSQSEILLDNPKYNYPNIIAPLASLVFSLLSAGTILLKMNLDLA